MSEIIKIINEMDIELDEEMIEFLEYIAYR